MRRGSTSSAYTVVVVWNTSEDEEEKSSFDAFSRVKTRKDTINTTWLLFPWLFLGQGSQEEEVLPIEEEGGEKMVFSLARERREESLLEAGEDDFSSFEIGWIRSIVKSFLRWVKGGKIPSVLPSLVSSATNMESVTRHSDIYGTNEKSSSLQQLSILSGKKNRDYPWVFKKHTRGEDLAHRKEQFCAHHLLVSWSSPSNY